MERETFDLIERYMLRCMDDAAHDREHVYRVLYLAMDIARYEEADPGLLIAACLLHDVGRKEQMEDPSVDHAAAGAEKAKRFLLEEGFDPAFAGRVSACIATHRYRSDHPPESIEAKILFDADKLDVTGAMGAARTLLYQGALGEPLYTKRPDGTISDGAGDTEESFFREYKFKLEKLYTRFFTRRAREIAASREAAARQFYEALLSEARADYGPGREALKELFH